MNIRKVDYQNPQDLQHLLTLLNDYAQTPTGGGQALDDEIKNRLAKDLPNINGAVSLIAFDEGIAVALLNAFTAYSTFAAKQVMNVHDLMVIESHQNRGIAKAMLLALETISKEHGYCKMTLEVLSGNKAAKRCYESVGFKPYELDPKQGSAEFWEKKL